MAQSKAKNDKPNIFVRFWRKTKEVFSELKKVTWPTFAKVVKTTGVVLVIVLVFVAIFTGINLGLSALLQLITNLG